MHVLTVIMRGRAQQSKQLIEYKRSTTVSFLLLISGGLWRIDHVVYYTSKRFFENLSGSNSWLIINVLLNFLAHCWHLWHCWQCVYMFQNGGRVYDIIKVLEVVSFKLAICVPTRYSLSLDNYYELERSKLIISYPFVSRAMPTRSASKIMTRADS